MAVKMFDKHCNIFFMSSDSSHQHKGADSPSSSCRPSIISRLVWGRMEVKLQVSNYRKNDFWRKETSFRLQQFTKLNSRIRARYVVPFFRLGIWIEIKSSLWWYWSNDEGILEVLLVMLIHTSFRSTFYLSHFRFFVPNSSKSKIIEQEKIHNCAAKKTSSQPSHE